MVGRELVDYFRRPKTTPGPVALEVRNLRNASVSDVSFKLHYGEVLGLAGLVGAGRTELARAIFGIDPLESGAIYLDGRQLTMLGPRDALIAGIVLVPEDRRKEGLVMTRSVAFNLALPWASEWNHGFMPDERRRSEIVRHAVTAYAIKTADVEQPIIELSGGNQQKVLVGRWMEHPPKVLILDEPTRGVDVGAREELSRIISGLVEQGMAVLLISSDLVELLSMSHRIGLYRRGSLLKIVSAEGISPEAVMTELTGATAHESP
jgi:ABC-type sugar transport system ATPase subunit